jgi:hypothetical protein
MAGEEIIAMKDTKGKGKAIKIVEDDEGSPF